ncbi:hypothetical protein FNU79_15840 [Deinococcus detaillensis]|uniref:Uncharacterized protein n=1 Tax=Deinococcus detaillensis TaxID=2592048 RepID=A0A553ULM6_9DEIO|nr:hypothetical protein [Deinococcus detaillensis]TSA81099.1 hypothetical protein FNU79_15840 [Deinococcus detaillensis]
MKSLMTTEQLLQGLKHYRRIARQDLLRAAETPYPDAFRTHAEARRTLYGELEVYAAEHAPEDVIEYALSLYRVLPFATGTPENEYAEIKGRENGLENFFLMIALDPRTRRESRSQRPKLGAMLADAAQAPSDPSRSDVTA